MRADDFTNNPAHAEIERLCERLQGLEYPEGSGERAYVERILHAVEHAKTVLSATDPLLVTAGDIGTISEIQAAVRRVNEAIDAQQTGTSSDGLGPADAAADEILDRLSAWIPFSAQDAISKLRHSAGQHSRWLKSEAGQAVDALKATVGEREEEVESLGEQVRTVASEAQTKATDIDARLTGLREQVDAERARIDTAVAEYQSQFSEAQEQRRQEFDERTSAQLKELNDKTTTAIANTEKRLDEFIAQAVERETELAALADKVRYQAGLAANASLAGGYQKEADEQRRVANLLRFFAGVALLAAVGIAGYLVIFTRLTTEQGVSAWVVKLGVTSALVLLFAYLRHESTVHRERERHARDLELRLKTIDPFLAELASEDRNAARKRLVPELFGGLNNTKGRRESPEPGAD